MAEGSRLLSGCGGKTPPRVRIPAPQPERTDERKERSESENGA